MPMKYHTHTTGKPVGAVLLAIIGVTVLFGLDAKTAFAHNCYFACQGASMTYCAQETIVGPLNTVETDEFFGEPLYLNATAACCAGTYSAIEIAASTATVAVGSWSGESGFTAKLALPAGYEFGTNGKLTASGSTTVTVNISAKTGCPAAGPCLRASAKVGPGYKTQTVTQSTQHRCWGSVGNCQGILVSCGHETTTETATATYLSSQIKEDIKCGLSNSGNCGPCICQ